MSAPSRWTIGRRLAATFAAVLALAALSTGWAAWHLHQATDSTRHMLEGPLARERLATDWFRLVHTGLRRVTAIARSGDPELARFFAPENEESAREGSAILERLSALSTGEDDRRQLEAVTAARKTYLADAVAAAQRVAGGDLSQPLPPVRGDELGRLIDALAHMQDSLASTIGGIRRAADTMDSASGAIADGNQELRQRTEQTAANLQRTSSAMEQLDGAVRQTAEAAQGADALAASATEVARRGGQAVAQVVQTMRDIDHSSHRIADIIGVIDGIAFQTHILALNAAVEAARAGEQGRGFAVVASEVRALAQRCAQAAREIKALIGTSVEQVGQGSRHVDEAGRTMNEVVGAVQKVADIVAEITVAARRQSQEIGEVKASVTDVDAMTHLNASLVEQSADSATHLNDQARQLVALVQDFKVLA